MAPIDKFCHIIGWLPGTADLSFFIFDIGVTNICIVFAFFFSLLRMSFNNKFLTSYYD